MESLNTSAYFPISGIGGCKTNLESRVNKAWNHLRVIGNSLVSNAKRAVYISVISSLALTTGARLTKAETIYADAPGLNNRIFYESFDDLPSIMNNKGNITTSYLNVKPNWRFVRGVEGNAIDFSCAGCELKQNEPDYGYCPGESYVSYPTPGDLRQGTIEFWFKPKLEFYECTPLNSRGFFDMGKLSGYSPNSMGVFWSSDFDRLIFEIREENTALRQSWSRQGLNKSTGWHHFAAVWRCNLKWDDYMQIFVDGIPGGRKFSNKYAFSPNATEFWVGKNFYYGSSFSVIDEFKIFGYPMTDKDVENEFKQILSKNKPSITYCSPQEDFLAINLGDNIGFAVDATDPNGDELSIEWFVNGNSAGEGSNLTYVGDKAGEKAMIKVVATDGGFSTEKEWGVWVQDSSMALFDSKFYIKGEKFLVKGVDYTPWLAGTGPDPRANNPLPGEYEDVTDKVTHNHVAYVPDYSGDGRIQTWEVIQYDLETIKKAGANTIRTYAAGEWHDKNLDGILDRSAIPEEDEIIQGDLPNWVIDRIVDFSEKNDMKVILGYWVQEEDFEDKDPNTMGYQLQCDWKDLNVAKDTLTKIVGRYGNSPAIIAWGIGNEVNGSWNHGWFKWTVNINEYLNSLFEHVRGIDTYRRPIMYAKFIGENADFNNLTADIIAPNAYIFSAQELINEGEFNIPAPLGKAYLLGEYGHRIEQAEGHWNLSKQYAGGCFIEYVDVLWKGGDQAEMGIVEEYRAIKPQRYNVVSRLYVRPGDLNNNGIVDMVDFALLAKDWFVAGIKQPSDLNQDGIANAADLALLAGSWLK